MNILINSTILPILVAILLLAGCGTAPIEMPDSTKLATHSSAEPVVIGNTYKIQSSIYKKERRITVRLPAGYEEADDKNFPVMFIIDGGPEQDFPHLAGMMQSVDINYTLEPFLLVGIETENRRYEITPPADDPRYSEVAEKRGGAVEFRRYIREDVIPWVKQNYRTQDDYGVIGESLGGLFIVETFLNDPTLFDRYAAISPSM